MPELTGLPAKIWEFAFFPYRDDPVPQREAQAKAWPNILSKLADLAEHEDWIGTNADGSDATENQILHNYISFTYFRLALEGRKVVASEDGNYATFNTGLLDSFDQEIFGFFQRNTQPGKQPWYFLRWAIESDRELMTFFNPTPDMADYVTAASDLVYDWRRPLILNYAHILDDDHMKRFPLELQKRPLRARSQLDAAVVKTLKRLRRNYKIAIPQWYPKLKEEGAQLLLPLDLYDEGTADLALVVSLDGDRYRGSTVLTLEMAYTYARLVARPDSEWSKPLSTVVKDQMDVGHPNAGLQRDVASTRDDRAMQIQEWRRS
ncbi:hypothetical protein PMIN06_007297 [Paraphaeosphaeria minitans]